MAAAGETCVECKKPFGEGEQFLKVGGKLMHESCYKRPHCVVCDKDIASSMVQASGKAFHTSCFNCSVCKSKITTSFALEGKVLTCAACKAKAATATTSKAPAKAGASGASLSTSGGGLGVKNKVLAKSTPGGYAGQFGTGSVREDAGPAPPPVKAKARGSTSPSKSGSTPPPSINLAGLGGGGGGGSGETTPKRDDSTTPRLEGVGAGAKKAATKKAGKGGPPPLKGVPRASGDSEPLRATLENEGSTTPTRVPHRDHKGSSSSSSSSSSKKKKSDKKEKKKKTATAAAAAADSDSSDPLEGLLSSDDEFDLLASDATAPKSPRRVGSVPADFVKMEALLNVAGQQQLVEQFKDEQVDYTALMLFGDDDLKALGLGLGPRKKLIAEIVKARRAAVGGSVATFVTKLGHPSLAVTFEREQIDFDALLKLGNADLKDLGVEYGPRRLLLHHIARINDGGTSE